MSRNGRIGLVAGAIVVAIVAFVIASPGGDDEDGGGTAQTTPAETQTESGSGDGDGEEPAEPGAEEPPETEAEPPAPPEPQAARIRLRGGQVVGGAQDITVASGEPVRIVVQSDAPDEIHVHGYDLTQNAAPGSPARFRFRADLEGAFEIESHTAEDAGRDPLIARLNVEPQ